MCYPMLLLCLISCQSHIYHSRDIVIVHLFVNQNIDTLISKLYDCFLPFFVVDSSGIRSIESDLETAFVMDHQRGNIKQ